MVSVPHSERMKSLDGRRMAGPERRVLTSDRPARGASGALGRTFAENGSHLGMARRSWLGAMDRFRARAATPPEIGANRTGGTRAGTQRMDMRSVGPRGERHGRSPELMRKRVAMRTYEYVACAMVAGVFLTLQTADLRAADAKALEQVPKTSLIDTFRDGVRAYYRGDKAVAVDKLRTAAESDHTMAQWKLGRMYADGDGVDEDDLKAFEYFSRVANAHVDELPNSPQAPFVADALIELGDYYLTGIKDSAVKPNVERARNLYTYAASYFGNSQAQYRLGQMYLETGEAERDPRLAARWLKLSAEKGNPSAQALLGDLLFFGEELPRRPVTGLMWLTIARQSATGPDSEWIRERQEKAFTRASDDERKRATQLADVWLGAKKTN
tara:strand:- start:1717 stop:2871 length:1155 start_codon:yes stop_codon:yes gene_type:complete